MPQREAYAALETFASDPASQEREIGVVLPVGCGKSGCITLTPFAFRATRTLVVAPSVPIAGQLQKDFDPSRPDMSYIKCDVLDGQPFLSTYISPSTVPPFTPSSLFNQLARCSSTVLYPVPGYSVRDLFVVLFASF